MRLAEKLDWKGLNCVMNGKKKHCVGDTCSNNIVISVWCFCFPVAIQIQIEEVGF